MKSKKHGNESSPDEQAQEDFFHAVDCTAELLQEFDTMGLEKGPAIGGALTQIIAHLIAISPDTASAMGMLSSCISNAAFHVDKCGVTHKGSDNIH